MGTPEAAAEADIVLGGLTRLELKEALARAGRAEQAEVLGAAVASQAFTPYKRRRDALANGAQVHHLPPSWRTLSEL